MTAESAAISDVVMAETKAIRLLRDGYSAGQVFDATGVTKDRLAVLASAFSSQRPAPAVPPRQMPPARPLTSTVVPREKDHLAELIADALASRVGSVRAQAKNVESAIEKLRRVMAGAAPVPADGQLVEKVPVDERRQQIPGLVAQGISKREIGRRMGVSEAQIYLDLKAIAAAS